MNLAVSVLTHSRLPYLSQTLTALAQCEGIFGWRVQVVLDDVDHATRLFVMDMAERHGWATVELGAWNEGEPYARVSRATYAALSLAFMDADFVAHLEEDCVPSADYLTYMATQAKRYRDDPRVFTVSAWWGSEGGPEPLLQATGLHPWLTPWGLGTWADRFEEMRQRWDFEYWDRALNERIRGDRLTVHPYVARVRDIGERGGVNPASEWRERQDRVRPVFADHVA